MVIVVSRARLIFTLRVVFWPLHAMQQIPYGKLIKINSAQRYKKVMSAKEHIVFFAAGGGVGVGVRLSWFKVILVWLGHVMYV